MIWLDVDSEILSSELLELFAEPAQQVRDSRREEKSKIINFRCILVII